MERAEWLSQLKRGVLEYSILLLAKNKSVYGYEIIASLAKQEILATAEGTLYPLLKRLEKDRLVYSTWRETSPGTPPRKYYDITDEGRMFLDMMDGEWLRLVSAVSHLKNDKEIEGNGRS